MRRLVLVLVALLLVGVACGGDHPAATVTGVITFVDGDLSGVESFTIRTTGGEELTLVPEKGLLFNGGPLSHLDSHRLSGAPVEATYEDRDGTLVAVEIADAH